MFDLKLDVIDVVCMVMDVVSIWLLGVYFGELM